MCSMRSGFMFYVTSQIRCQQELILDHGRGQPEAGSKLLKPDDHEVRSWYKLSHLLDLYFLSKNNVRAC
jgi:hypothetical protein